MSHEPRVLLYIAADDSDDPWVAAWLDRQATLGFEIVQAVGHESGRAALDSGLVNVLVLDLALGRTPCLFLLREGRAKNPIESAYIFRDDSALRHAGFAGVWSKGELATFNLGDPPPVPETEGESSIADGTRDFLSRIAHDVRTPLHGIHGALDLLENTGMSPIQKDYAKIARDAAEALMSVVDDVTDHINPGRSQPSTAIFPFEPRTCLERVAAVMGPKASSKGLDFVHRTHFGVPWRVEGDPNALREILGGLTAHLIRHTSRGIVVVDMDASEASEARAALRFRVGIEDADLDVGPGAQSTGNSQSIDENSISVEHCGKLAASLGGELKSERTESGASRYEFAIPFNALPDRLPLTNVGPEALEGREVLVVDDSGTNRAVYREQLANWGCDVVEASNGSEALEIIDSQSRMGTPIDIAVIDYVMDGMDGADLARAIRALPNGGETRLILCTSNPRGGDAVNMMEAGFNAYLTKPVRFDCLSKTMCLLLGNRDAEQESFPLITQHVVAEMDRAAGSILYVGGGRSQDRDMLIALQREGLPCDLAGFDDDPTGPLAARKYGAILVDCRAALAEGLEQAVRIRGAEGGQDVPLAIIVRQRDADCHAAGINEVLVDPVDPDELRSTVRGLLGLDEPDAFDEELNGWETEDSGVEPMDTGSSPIDMDRLEEVTAGDLELRQELIEMFITDTEERFSSIESAITGQDGHQLNRTAHSIKGSSANMGAQTLQVLAQELESMGSEGRFDEAPELFANLKNEFEVVKIFFGSL